LYWLGGRSRLVLSFAMAMSAAVVYWRLGGASTGVNELAHYLRAFLIGVSLFYLRQDAAAGWFGLAAAASALGVMWLMDVTPHSMPVVSGAALLALTVSTVLMLIATSSAGARWTTRWLGALAWLGLFSYPLYLLHQDIGLALIELLPRGEHWIARLVIVPASVIGLAWAVHRLIEYRYQKSLTRVLAGGLRAGEASQSAGAAAR
jgi:peptidoglycan/LPS O-acetylase OafA/YrhL